MNTTAATARLLLATGLEVQVAHLSSLGDRLLARIEGSDAAMAATLWREALRLFGASHQITCLLSRGDIDAAVRVGADDALADQIPARELATDKTGGATCILNRDSYQWRADREQ